MNVKPMKRFLGKLKCCWKIPGIRKRRWWYFIFIYTKYEFKSQNLRLTFWFLKFLIYHFHFLFFSQSFISVFIILWFLTLLFISFQGFRQFCADLSYNLIQDIHFFFFFFYLFILIFLVFFCCNCWFFHSFIIFTKHRSTFF